MQGISLLNIHLALFPSASVIPSLCEVHVEVSSIQLRIFLGGIFPWVYYCISAVLAVPKRII